jgi:hypothetical protein
MSTLKDAQAYLVEQIKGRTAAIVDLEAVLCEDQSALITVDLDDGDTLASGFDPPAPFDADAIVFATALILGLARD